MLFVCTTDLPSTDNILRTNSPAANHYFHLVCRVVPHPVKKWRTYIDRNVISISVGLEQNDLKLSDSLHIVDVDVIIVKGIPVERSLVHTLFIPRREHTRVMTTPLCRYLDERRHRHSTSSWPRRFCIEIRVRVAHAFTRPRAFNQQPRRRPLAVLVKQIHNGRCCRQRPNPPMTIIPCHDNAPPSSINNGREPQHLRCHPTIEPQVAATCCAVMLNRCQQRTAPTKAQRKRLSPKLLQACRRTIVSSKCQQLFWK